MNDALTLIDNAALQGLGFGIAVIGLAIAFRVVRYPDLTGDGSFILGASVFAAALPHHHWVIALGLAAVSGASAGAFTAMLNSLLGISRLLTGILTSMIAYSIAFRLMNGSPTAALQSEQTMFAGARQLDLQNAASGLHAGQLAVLGISAIALAVVVFWILRSQFGFALRAVGANPWLGSQFKRRPAWMRAWGLALANSIIAVGGAIVSAQQGFADINLGIGIIIILVAALVIGEELCRLLSRRWRQEAWVVTLAPLFGALVYFALYLLIVRASIRGWIPIEIAPTDLKMLSALVIIVALSWRKTRPKEEDILPL